MGDNYFLLNGWQKLLAFFSAYDVLVACLVMFVITVVVIWKFCSKKYKLPPGPHGAPNLGSEPHKKLDNFKQIYGNVFSLYIGWTYTIILGDFEAVKEVYAKTTKKSAGFDIIPDALGFSGQNGEEWIEQRKFSLKSMRDVGIGKEKWESVIQAEVDDLVKYISSFKGQPIDINKMLASSTSNNISSFLFGKHLPMNHPDRIFLDAVSDEIFQLLGQAPSNGFLSVLQDISIKLGIGDTYKKLKKFNKYFRDECEKLKESYKSGEHENFIVHYLKAMDSQKDKSGHFFKETNLYGNVQGFFLGASTIHSALYWLFLIMATFREVQDKVHHELDSVIGESSQMRWADRHKVPFLFATIMEGQRWRTLTPLNSARKAISDMKLQNYDIPEGTPIVANIWSLHNDPKYWNEPEKFSPERFLTKNRKEIITRPDSYIPFSYGKRNCPGETVALMEIFLTFTALMQNFVILPPEGIKLNLDGKQGITFQAFPQDICFVPRKQKNIENV